MPIAQSRPPQPQLLQPPGVPTISLAAQTKRTAPSTAKGGHGKLAGVRFNEKVWVRPITHIDDLSDDDVNALWFSKEDFYKIKKSIAATVRLISSGVYAGDDDHHCKQGLEYRLTKSAALKRRDNKWRALQAVLSEQERQRSLGIQDNMMISEAYMEENLRCRLTALRLGGTMQAIFPEQERQWRGGIMDEEQISEACAEEKLQNQKQAKARCLLGNGDEDNKKDCMADVDKDAIAVENFRKITKAALWAPARRFTP